MTTKADKIKHLDDDAEIEIMHPKTGERYGVTAAAFRADYEPAGFEVDRMGDGSAIVSDRDEPKAPDDLPALGVQGEPQPGTVEAGEGAVTPQADTTGTEG